MMKIATYLHFTRYLIESAHPAKLWKVYTRRISSILPTQIITNFTVLWVLNRPNTATTSKTFYSGIQLRDRLLICWEFPPHSVPPTTLFPDSSVLAQFPMFWSYPRNVPRAHTELYALFYFRTAPSSATDHFCSQKKTNSNFRLSSPGGVCQETYVHCQFPFVTMTSTSMISEKGVKIQLLPHHFPPNPHPNSQRNHSLLHSIDVMSLSVTNPTPARAARSRPFRIRPRKASLCTDE